MTNKDQAALIMVKELKQIIDEQKQEIARLKAESIDHVFCACHRELTYKIELNSICVDRCICQEQEIAQLQAEVAAWIGVCVKNRSK